MWFYLFLLATSALMFLRTLLVMLGQYKDPVLHSFEQYGEEPIYSPLLWFILWSVLFAYFLSYLLLPSGLLFVSGLIVGCVSFAFRDVIAGWIVDYPQIFRRFPRWYHEFIQHTTREERRRVAYMWLRLPARTRLLYNTHTVFFKQWADLVLMTIAR